MTNDGHGFGSDLDLLLMKTFKAEKTRLDRDGFESTKKMIFLESPTIAGQVLPKTEMGQVYST